MEKKEYDYMAYQAPPYELTPPHEREILKEIGSRRSYMQPLNSPPLRLLSLDGGGVKGYSSLLLLQEVMYRVFVEINGRPPQMHEIPLPCDHFDLIGGVGTGGLIGLMLGRLRMDIETCKETWVKMTKRVFETDKTIVGIPYKTTFFKASRLESAIKEIIKEYTAGEEELAKAQNQRSGSIRDKSDLPPRPRTRAGSTGSRESRYSRRSDELRKLAEEGGEQDRDAKFDPLVRHRSHQESSSIVSSIISGKKLGNAETLLYDPREDRCKTFVAAMYQHSPEGTPPCLLRTYLSLTTLNPEPNVKIWEAGRATAATLTAFKPIQIGQTVFLDEGAGRYNITPTLLEEATCNEWPGRAVGCILSIGTGKPPPKKQVTSQPWWENKIHTPFDNFTEARKRLIYKTHLSEDIHQMLIGSGANSLDKWGIQKDDYFRLNVDIGVGDFAMNDWQRLADISTNTRRWLTSNEGKRLVGTCALRLATIWRARNIPPPKSPLRMIPPMAELPVEPMPYTPKSKPLPQDPPKSPLTPTPIDSFPRPPSRSLSRPKMQPFPSERPSTGLPTITPPQQIGRSRTIQVPGENTRQGHSPSPSLPQEYITQPRGSNEDHRSHSHSHSSSGGISQPRPLTIRQRSQTAGSTGPGSSSVNLASINRDAEKERDRERDKERTERERDRERDRRFDKQQYMNIQAGVKPGSRAPKQQGPPRRVMTEGTPRPNPPYPDD
ncbi:hypothetical protein ABW19_dt0206406 [Dactylella cylindrospora]|nr:hypothetical protein ABW19_dt0206406 [Dactylella cylindrospora]